MAQSIREVMTKDPVTLTSDSSVLDAATQMRDRNIGDILITDGRRVHGVVTDRDIVVRTVAAGQDPSSTKVGDICSTDVVTISPDDKIDDAVRLMRERAIRRLPVVENDQPVGIVSIGDLAVERDRNSALADISASEPNN